MKTRIQKGESNSMSKETESTEHILGRANRIYLNSLNLWCVFSKCFHICYAIWELKQKTNNVEAYKKCIFYFT